MVRCFAAGSDTKAQNSSGKASILLAVRAKKTTEGTFTDRTLMATTGVNSRMVEIEKPDDIRA